MSLMQIAGRFRLYLMVVLAISTMAGQVLAELKTVDARIDLSHLYSDDNVSDRHISLSQLRSTLDLSFDDFEFHLDGRGRLGWNQVRTTQKEITRLYLQYGHQKSAWVALGRQTIPCVINARVDGIHAGLSFTENFSAGAFAGLMPHPITGDLNTDFATFGLGYQVSGDGIQNMGGISLQTYGSLIDRLYFTERLLWMLGSRWTLFGFVVMDALAPKGLLGDMRLVEAEDQTSIERIDLTTGQLMIRYRPSKTGNITLRVSHHHSILPSVWWQDWLQKERMRRGFVIDGDRPVGTRRSSARLIGNLRLGKIFTPYTILRYDRRHSDKRDGYEVRPGLKINIPQSGFLDVSYSYRRYFVVENHLASVSGGVDLGEIVSVDAGLAAMYSQPLEESNPEMLYDIDVGIWINLERMSYVFKGLRLLLQYQAFMESDMIYQLGHVRMVYRFSS